MITQTYPELLGTKGTGGGRQAAELAADSADLTREQCLSLLRANDLTADEIAMIICKDVHDVRSRCSELQARGEIFYVGLKRENSRGIRTKVWMVRKV